MSEPALVLFDLDGTLVDSVPDLARAVDQMLAALGREPAGVAGVREWVGNGVEMLVRRALAGCLEVDAAAPQDAALLPVALELFKAAYAQANGRSSQVYPGVRELLEHYRAGTVPMAVVTNKPTAFTQPLLERMALASYFSVVVCGDTLARKKPDPDPLLHACERIGVSPRHSLMVGDSRVDVDAARAAGCSVVGVSYGYNQGEPIASAGADRVVASLAELIDTPFLIR